MTSKIIKSVPAQEEQTEKPKNRKAPWISIIVVVCLVIAGAVYFMQRSKTDPEAPTVSTSVPIAITGLAVPAQTKVGIIVTFGSASLDGTQWNQAAQGARVAQQRLALGGTDIELVTLNDQGSPEGAENAVQALADEGVAGIIIATSGPQVETALSSAEQAGIATILPYTKFPTAVEDSRSLYPISSKYNDVLKDALNGYANTLLIDAGEEISEEIVVADTLPHTAGQDLGALADEVAKTTGANVATNGAYFGGEKETADTEETADTVETEDAPVNAPHDAVLISGAPELQAKIVHALQTKNIAVPIILAQSATSPGFATALFEAGGTVAPNLVTIGTAGSESIALQKTEHGQSMSAFFAALRTFSNDAEVLNLTEDASFGSVSTYADPLSHDAVLALVTAVSQAQSNDLDKVTAAFTSLGLQPKDGIAGLSLDFGSAPYPNTEKVHVLHATAQNLGLRGKVEDGSQTLVWFPQP